MIARMTRRLTRDADSPAADALAVAVLFLLPVIFLALPGLG